MSPDVRYQAVGAIVVATVGNLQIRHVRRSCKYALAKCNAAVACRVKLAFVGKGVGNDVANVSVAVYACDGVGFGQSVKHFLPEFLPQTTCDNHLFALTVLLEVRHFQHGFDGFLARRLQKSACIYNYYVGFARVGSDFVAAFGEVFQHYFGIHAVFVATEGHHSDFCTHFFLSNIAVCGNKRLCAVTAKPM